jgi:NTE family protein
VKRTLLAAVVSTALFLSVHDDAIAETAKRPKRPRIALVLEGGGAKGFAHVGVLKVLEEERVPIDFIVGTSMGSIVGAAYASGRTIPEMEEVLSTTNWDKLFDEEHPRREVHYRQKAGRDREIFGDTKVGLKNGEIVTPLAFVQGQNVEPMLQRLFGKVPSSVSFDNVPVPFRAIAADIETGQGLVLSEGSLASSARASMSVPGFFTPVEINGRLLVDGGIVNNLPVNEALKWGADVIIAVECKDFLRTRDRMEGPLAISAQILDILLERNTQEAVKLLRTQDVHLTVKLGEYSSTSFKDAVAIMKLGEQTAGEQRALLKPLALPEEEYALYAAARTGAEPYSPTIQYVRIEQAEGYEADEMEQAFKDAVGKSLDREFVEEKLTSLVQAYDLQKATYDLEEKDGKTGLVVKAQPKLWLKNFARLGFSLEDNFKGESNYNLALEARLNDFADLGGYLNLQLEAGRTGRATLELYQPVAGSRFFVSPELAVSKQQLLLRNEEEIVGEYLRFEESLKLKGGYSFGKYGELSGGWRWGRGDLERRIGDPTLPEVDYDIGELFTRLVIDQLDNPDFPTQGYNFGALGTFGREGVGADSDYEQLRALASIPFTFGQTTLLLNGEVGVSSDDLPVEKYSSLGGFFDISGFERSSLTTSDYWVYRSAMYRRIAEGGSSLFPFGGYIGMTFEVATLRNTLEAIPDMPGIVGGSVFIGADTPLLPIYLGFGMNDESEKSVYLNVGRIPGKGVN